MRQRSRDELMTEVEEARKQYWLSFVEGRDPLKIAFWKGVYHGLLFAIDPAMKPIKFPLLLNQLREKFLIAPIKKGGE